MANVNVRFYKLEVLPNFDVSKQGIFVHVTKTMYKNPWDLSDKENPKKIDPSTLWMTPPDKDGGNVGRINLVKWLSNRQIVEIASGLWFGGENGWELLSNETNSIDATINAKIAALDVEGYAQATITPDTPAEGVPNSSTLTIKGIQEVDGKIGTPAESENLDLDIAIDGVYDETNNKIATESTVTTAVTTAIEALDSEGTIQAVTKTTSGNNTTLNFKGVKETNGVIAQGTSTDTFTVGDAKLKIQIGSATATDVFSANAQSDSTIQLDGFVFKKNGDVISVITPTAVASDNRLVTEKDVASINGAMHYQGSIANASAWPSTTPKKGDVYIAIGNFEKDSNIIQSGDMIVFGDNGSFTVVQSNITLGTGDGQIAKNVGVLATGNNVVIATSGGIKTIDITENDLTNTTEKNTRTLSIGDGEADTTGVCHDVTITDALTVIGKPFTKSINITSTNRSIEIKKKTVDGVDTGVMVDLVWNTRLD